VSAAIRRVDPGGKTLPHISLPSAQTSGNDTTVLLHTASDPLSVVSALRSQALAIDKKLPLSSVAPMNDLLTGETADQRFEAAAVGLFAALALTLAGLGIYGVISYMVSQRTNNEVGIRMALGAEKRDELKMVLGQGLKLALTRFLSSFLYGIKPTDPLTFIVVSLILVAVALAACYIPARRAAKVDPLVVLRYE
jgi:putative ABC transport system permease protein